MLILISHTNPLRPRNDFEKVLKLNRGRLVTHSVFNDNLWQVLDSALVWKNSTTENIFYPTNPPWPPNIHKRSGNLTNNNVLTLVSPWRSESWELQIKNSLYFSSRLLDLSIFWTVDIYNIKPFKPAVCIYFVRHNK